MEEREMFRPSIMNAVCWQMMDLLKAKRRGTSNSQHANSGSFSRSGNRCSTKRINGQQLADTRPSYFPSIDRYYPHAWQLIRRPL